jgi:hypothetical protein
VREYRLLGWLQAGLSHQEIAGLEGISRTRVRQLAADALKAREHDLTLDPRLLAEHRLAPALRLAAKTSTEGSYERLFPLTGAELEGHPEAFPS